MWKILRTDIERELFIVLKENQILKQTRRSRRLNHWDRYFYLALRAAPKHLLSRLLVIKPETVLGWHRKLARMKWDHGRQGRVGRPPVTREIHNLVIEMKMANPRWGAQRIMGELKKLGLKTCKATVLKILREAGFTPKGTGATLRWTGFIANHGKRVFACDFFKVDTLFLKTLEVFFIIDISTREIVSYAVSPIREAEHLRNHLRSVFSFSEKLPHVLVSDRDRVYGKWLKPFLQDYYGIQLKQTPPYIPIFNCFAERMVRTFREELTDRVLIYSEQDLHAILREYVAYYNMRRTHSSLAFGAPKKSFHPSSDDRRGKVRRSRVLDGLIIDFELAA